MLLMTHLKNYVLRMKLDVDVKIFYMIARIDED